MSHLIVGHGTTRDPAAVRFVGMTDIHAAHLPPGRRRASYCNEILRKIAFAADLANEHAAAGICGGDVFHVKQPRSPSNSHWLVGQMVLHFAQFPLGRVFGDIGNHDITGDNVDTIPDQPLGVLIQSGVYADLAADPVVFSSADEKSTTVEILAFDYNADGRVTLEQVKALGPKTTDFRLLILHAFCKPGKSAPLHSDFAIGFKDLEGLPVDLIFWGHDHASKGVIVSGNVTHVQLGSLARAALSTDEVDRDVAIPLMTFRTGQPVNVQVVKVPVLPLEQAFHTADVAVGKVERIEEVTTFFKDIQEQATTVSTGTKPSELLYRLCPDADIRTMVQETCEIEDLLPEEREALERQIQAEAVEAAEVTDVTD